MATPLSKPPATGRMQLSAVVRGKIEKPARVLLYGVEGVGKSTFAASAPSPIFLAAEDGTAQLDVARFPEPKTWSDVLDAVDELTTGQHEFKTLVVDTLDWLEPLCWASLYTDKITSIEDFGYGKGYTAALDQWRLFLARLERMRDARGMGIIFLAHSWVKPFKNPEGDDFDRYELKLHNKAGGLLKEWCDAVLFTRYETFTDKDSKTKRVRGVSTGARVMHTNRTAAYDAKNRYDLPDVMPLDFASFAESVKTAKPADPAQLVARINGLLESADEATAKRVNAAVAKADGNAAQLARIADHLSATVNIASKTQESAQ